MVFVVFVFIARGISKPVGAVVYFVIIARVPPFDSDIRLKIADVVTIAEQSSHIVNHIHLSFENAAGPKAPMRTKSNFNVFLSHYSSLYLPLFVDLKTDEERRITFTAPSSVIVCIV